jgi:hypothetical protein
VRVVGRPEAQATGWGVDDMQKDRQNEPNARKKARHKKLPIGDVLVQ